MHITKIDSFIKMLSVVNLDHRKLNLFFFGFSIQIGHLSESQILDQSCYQVKL